MRKSAVFIRKLSFVITLLILFLSSGCQTDNSVSTAVASDTPPPPSPTNVATPLTEQPAISVPQGAPPAIDGSLSPGEWDRAAVETFADGGQLLLMQVEGYLYLAIRADTPDMIVGNIFIDRGDEIAILHASAALGTALYQKGIDAWQLTQEFDWRCRRTDDGQEAQAERQAFLEQEAWVAANSRMGNSNELEYQIEVANEALRLAANYIRASNPNVKIPWPSDLDDDCIKPTPGSMPAQLYFSPDRWGLVVLSASQSK
jgi:hypothetical protein